jgi:hypothetical protein
LPSGSYALFVKECAGSKGTPLWTSQYYDNASTLATANRLTLTAGIEPPVPVIANFTLVRASARRPLNTALPTIAGTAAPGQTLSCSTGAWSAMPPPTYSYQWMRDGVTPIPGAVASQYTVQSADEGAAISCLITATNEAGAASVASATVQVPRKPAPEKAGVAASSRPVKVNARTVEVTIATVKGKGTKGHDRKPKMKSVVIGEAPFSIEAGGHQTVGIQLTRNGRRLLATAGRHGLQVQLAGIDVESRTLVLKVRSQARRRRGGKR